MRSTRGRRSCARATRSIRRSARGRRRRATSRGCCAPGWDDAERTPAESAAGPLALLVALSAVLLAIRLYAASHVGFADSEALYACYALHPQPAYLDHPGLIGVVARAIGGGAPLTPEAAHQVTAVLATLVPWMVALAARLAGATWRSALVAGLAVAAAPEISFGLFAHTPDHPLAFAWLGALGLAAAGLRAPASSGRAAAALLFAGMLAGVACAAKVSGVLLVVSLARDLRRADPRARARAHALAVGRARPRGARLRADRRLRGALGVADAPPPPDRHADGRGALAQEPRRRARRAMPLRLPGLARRRRARRARPLPRANGTGRTIR